MDGHFAPAHDFHALFLRDDFKHPLCKSPPQGILRQEKHADAVVAFFRLYQAADPGFTGFFGSFLSSFLGKVFGKEFVGDLG